MGTSGASVPRVRATIVGSDPTPAWLAAPPSASALRDAVSVVLQTLRSLVGGRDLFAGPA